MRELRKDSQYQMGMNFIVGENGYDFITPTLMYTDEYRWAMSAHMCGSVLVQYLARQMRLGIATGLQRAWRRCKLRKRRRLSVNVSSVILLAAIRRRN